MVADDLCGWLGNKTSLERTAKWLKVWTCSWPFACCSYSQMVWGDTEQMNIETQASLRVSADWPGFSLFTKIRYWWILVDFPSGASFIELSNTVLLCLKCGQWSIFVLHCDTTDFLWHYSFMKLWQEKLVFALYVSRLTKQWNRYRKCKSKNEWTKNETNSTLKLDTCI